MENCIIINQRTKSINNNKGKKAARILFYTLKHTICVSVKIGQKSDSNNKTRSIIIDERINFPVAEDFKAGETKKNFFLLTLNKIINTKKKLI